MAIEEATDLATLPLDELVGNLKQTSDDSDSQGGSDEDVDEEEAKEFNLMARNFCLGEATKVALGTKVVKAQEKKGACYNCGVEYHFASECTNPKEDKAFVKRAWSNSEDGDELQNDVTYLMEIDS
ncbi:retrovirus-related pol polyprotein from transposon 17.6 [Tanacetum coccineum]